MKPEVFHHLVYKTDTEHEDTCKAAATRFAEYFKDAKLMPDPDVNINPQCVQVIRLERDGDGKIWADAWAVQAAMVLSEHTDVAKFAKGVDLGLAGQIKSNRLVVKQETEGG